MIGQRPAFRILRGLWTLRGYRTVRLFGTQWRLTPETEFPVRPGCACPRGAVTDLVVRYTDFVQMHAAFRCLSETDHPPVVVDVGAFHGAYAVPFGVLAKQKFGTGRIIAVEPNPVSLSVLHRNIDLNDLGEVVQVVPVAVSDREGKMWLNMNESQSCLHTARGTGDAVEVTVRRLDELIGTTTRIDLLMIDVEGAELPVLRGLNPEQLSQAMILCELHPYAWRAFGYGDAEFAQFLRERGLVAVDAYWRVLGDRFGSSYIGPTRLVSENFCRKAKSAFPPA